MAILSLIKGTTGNDTLVGTDLYDVIFGGAGNDTIDGGAGNDKLYGGDGNDTFLGGAGEDQMSGDAGIDTVDYSNSQAAVTVSLSTGTGSGGDAQGDTLSGIENLIGSNDRDHGDNLRGDGGNNIIDGGWGSDFLFGSGGNDTLIGGAGSDTMSGGRDADTFVFNTVHRPGGDVFIEGNDVITDFQVGLDVLEFTGPIDSLAELSFARAANGNDTVITTPYGGSAAFGGSITLVGVNYDQLMSHASHDFLFV